MVRTTVSRQGGEADQEAGDDHVGQEPAADKTSQSVPVVVDDEQGGGAKKHVRTVLLVSTSLYMFLYAGAFFGYGPMQLMLEESGAFASRCSPDEEELPCPAQTSMLLNVQFVAQLTMISSPLLGAGCDKYGPFVMINISLLMGTLGLALLTASTSLGIDNMLFPAFISLGFMANISGLFTVQTGLVFPQGRSRNRAISSLNALFDAGAITYLVLWYISKSVPLPTISGCYLGIFVLVVGAAAICWRKVTRILNPSNEDDEDEEQGSNDDVDDVAGSVTNTPADESVKEGICESGIREDGAPEESSGVDATPTSNDRAVSFADASCLETTSSSDQLFSDEVPPASANRSRRASSYIKIADRLPRRQLLSGQYIALASFFAFHQARNIWILTTTRDFLAYLGDDETGNKYLSIFTLLTPVSVLGLPCVDAILFKYGYGLGLQVVNVLGMAQGIIQVSSDNLNVQVVGFIFYSFYRCFLFSVSFSCLPAFLSGQVLGKGYGFLILCGGVLGLVNIPLSNVAVNLLGGNFFIPNLLYLLGCIPCSCLAWRVGRGFKREKKEGELPVLARLRQSKMLGAG
mmetsp:Transcript_7389/g.16142  ORF Transcript_7389/g.16142 Transcript_7389/m.16142 type:complete len:576 (-) Transcript_7389:44-1771(-)|eukprot:CAMPEP_0178509340 /NCGR_PEP_ID=MMETSP0696-20121128/21236_1 /TAXON_ID=265572 /ORGANISM="Extubocellulus spinifer, Strain CCMP396" /LENGTH=575 /DNA_ID=CAMNT_0020138959 /DNA_START=308 /DNA_END=2035 /DNA_ORIENTATION=+